MSNSTDADTGVENDGKAISDLHQYHANVQISIISEHFHEILNTLQHGQVLSNTTTTTRQTSCR